MRNWRVEFPGDENFSDDELGYLAMFAYQMVSVSIPLEYQIPFIYSLSRSYTLVKSYKPSIWTYFTVLMNETLVDD